MSPLRTRRFQPGDEVQIRDLLIKVKRGHPTVCNKSLEFMRWQWLHAPGGPMDSWIIEAEEPDGSTKIVGHHGLCPTRFTFGDVDLLFAKTSNTMLLPEYRSKFLYLRFEQECLREADRRFDATYCCAPGTARLRSQLGYVSCSHWIHMVRGLQTPEMISRILGFVANRYSSFSWNKIKRSIAAVSSSLNSRLLLSLMEYSPIQAAQSDFFADFWSSARLVAGMSARRDVQDLTWRFWQRPGFRYSTLINTWEGGARAYCVVNITDPLIFHLEDIFVSPPRADLLQMFILAVFAWCARKGALLLRFSTTTDGQPKEFLDVFSRYMHLSPLRPFRPEVDFPRRFSSQGKSKLGRANVPSNATLLLLPA